VGLYEYCGLLINALAESVRFIEPLCTGPYAW
jgi:hypothetical protein